MEAITIFAPKLGFQLSLSSRTHLSPASELTRFPLTACPIKPTKLVRSKANSLSCDSQETNRKFQKFPSSGWTHLFHSVQVDASEMEALRREMDTLKPYLKKKLMSSHGIDSTKQSILVIYLLVSLGIAYHFEDEIEEILKEGFGKIEEIMAGEDDLYTVSIIFWVLRTYGHHMSSDVFRQFKGNTGKFKECLSGDAKGMLALYEAAQLRTTTDNIMDEALSFATSRLELLATDGRLPPHLSMHIRTALGLSQHRNMEILVVIEYIPFYEQEEDHDKKLLKFAKLNFNLMQLHYIEELKIVTKWYEDQDFAANLPPYFRGVVVENHFYSVGLNIEPKFAKQRIILTKVFMALVILDDTYDRYASLPEAESLTNSLERWAPDVAMDRQPNYLKFVFKFMVNCFEEFERELTSERSYSVKATREVINIYLRSNFELAKWAQAGHVPSFDEYMKVGEVEIAIDASLAGSFLGMGNIDNEKVYEWLKSRPKLVQTSSHIGRLMNDVAGFEGDMSRGYVTTGVNCYMKQYDVTQMEAIRELRKLVVYYHKVLNDEFLKEIDVPCQIRKQVFNITRTAYVAYNEGEGFINTEGKINEYITSVFVTRIPL